jgi:hypothetical protein
MLNAGTDTTAGGAVLLWPSGGRAIGGLGEKSSADLFTVTGNFSVPIGVAAGRGCVQPQPSVSVSTGNDNGPFGLAWGLRLPGISRRPSHGMVGAAHRATSFEPLRFRGRVADGEEPFGVRTEGRRSGCRAGTIHRHEHWSASWLR